MESKELSHLAYHLDMLGVVPLKKVEEEKEKENDNKKPSVQNDQAEAKKQESESIIEKINQLIEQVINRELIEKLNEEECADKFGDVDLKEKIV